MARFPIAGATREALPTAPRAVWRWAHGQWRAVDDEVAAEEPLQIDLAWPDALEGGGATACRTLAITMRTPGDDADLALGFLLGEGIIDSAGDVSSIHQPSPNRVRVELVGSPRVAPEGLERHVYTSSSCGVCGKTSIDAVLHAADGRRARWGAAPLSPPILLGWPGRARSAQEAFERTGGLHAAALFRRERLLGWREDVGRHNALDKLIGARARLGDVDPEGLGLLLSGRASFELVQKAAMAGVAVVAAIGAPSSLAVGLAEALHITLIGFLRDGRFNVYCHPERIGAEEGSES